MAPKSGFPTELITGEVFMPKHSMQCQQIQCGCNGFSLPNGQDNETLAETF
jgi:hypothetical protein